MALTARQVETAKPKDKDYKLSDERGLYLLVKTTGARYWRFKYRIAGKEKNCPSVSILTSPLQKPEPNATMQGKLSPRAVIGEKKRREKLSQKISVTNTFHALAIEWHHHKSLSWSDSYARSVLEALDKDVFPYLSNRSVTDILPLEMLEILRRIEKRGSLEKLRKVRQYCNQIFRYAIATGRATVNPASELSSTLAAPKTAHFPHLRADELPVFLRKLADYHGSPVTRMATNLLILTGLRTIELRLAEWSEIDSSNALWHIPRERMKMRRPHIVPLSRGSFLFCRNYMVLPDSIALCYPDVAM